MSTTACTAVVLAEDPAEQAEAMALAGFLAGYASATDRLRLVELLQNPG